MPYKVDGCSFLSDPFFKDYYYCFKFYPTDVRLNIEKGLFCLNKYVTYGLFLDIVFGIAKIMIEGHALTIGISPYVRFKIAHVIQLFIKLLSHCYAVLLSFFFFNILRPTCFIMFMLHNVLLISNEL